MFVKIYVPIKQKERSSWMESNLDIVWNSSSLVPLTKPTLSSRESITHLLVNAAAYQVTGQSSREGSQERSNSPFATTIRNQTLQQKQQQSPETADPATRSKIKTQASIFLQNKQMLQQSGCVEMLSKTANSDYADLAGSHTAHTQHRSSFNRTTNMTWGRSNQGSTDPRDQLIIDREHAVPRQPLRRVNVLEPRINPKQQTRNPLSDSLSRHQQARIHRSREQTATQQGRISDETASKQEVVYTGNTQTQNLINVQIVFDNEEQAFTDTQTHSQRDPNILTLRNSEDVRLQKTPSQLFRIQQRAQSTLQGAKRHKNNYNEITAGESEPISGQFSMSQVYKITANLPKSYPTGVEITEGSHEQTYTLTDDCVLIDKEGVSPRRLGQAVVFAVTSTPTRPETKTITVNLDQPVQMDKLKRNNTLTKQNVSHSFYKGEKGEFKSIAEYGYDSYGTIINQHKMNGKKPTVKKFIKKACDDLNNQIRGQREYLVKVLGNRLRDTSQDNETTGGGPGGRQAHHRSQSRSKSPADINHAAFNTSQASQQRQTKAVDPKSHHLNEISVQGVNPTSRWHQELQASKSVKLNQEAENILVKELYDKMQWLQQSVEEQKNEQTPMQQYSKDSIESGSAHVSINHLERSSRSYPEQAAYTMERSPRLYKQTKTTTAPIKILQQNNDIAEDGDVTGVLSAAVSSSRRIIPNSMVPQVVRPPETKAESTVLNSCMARVGSNTSSEVDKNILSRLKEIEAMGQQLFGQGSKHSSNIHVKVSQTQIQPPSIFTMASHVDDESSQQQVPTANHSQLQATSTQHDNQYDTFGNNKLHQSSTRETAQVTMVKASQKSTDLRSIKNAPGLIVTGFQKKNQASTLPISRVHSAAASGDLEDVYNGQAAVVSDGLRAHPHESDDNLLKSSKDSQNLNKETIEEGMRVFQSTVLNEIAAKSPKVANKGAKQDLCPLQAVQNSSSSKSKNQLSHAGTSFEQHRTPEASHSPNTMRKTKLQSSKFEAFSTSTLLKGDQSGISIIKDSNLANRNRQQLANNWTQFSSISPTQMQIDGRTIAGQNSQSKEKVGTVTLAGKSLQVLQSERDKNLSSRRQMITQTNTSDFLKLQSVTSHTPLEQTTPPLEQTPIKHIEEEEEVLSGSLLPATPHHESSIENGSNHLEKQSAVAQSPALLKLVYAAKKKGSRAPFECEIDIRKLLKESPHAELTSEQFEEQCFAYFRKAFEEDVSRGEQKNLPKQLSLSDLKGRRISSILDWMQEKGRRGLADDHTLVVCEKVVAGAALNENRVRSIKVAHTDNLEVGKIGTEKPVSPMMARFMKLPSKTLEPSSLVGVASSSISNKSKKPVSIKRPARKEHARRNQLNKLQSSQMTNQNDLVVIGRQSNLSHHREGSNSPRQQDHSPRKAIRQSPRHKEQQQPRLADDRQATPHTAEHQIGEMVMQDSSFTSQLQEDSIFSVNGPSVNNSLKKPEQLLRNGDSADELNEKMAFAPPPKKQMIHQPHLHDISYINVERGDSNIQKNPQQSNNKLSKKLSSSNNRQSYQAATAPHASNFHNYVCTALLEQLDERPKVRTLNFEERMSNPASLTATTAIGNNLLPAGTLQQPSGKPEEPPHQQRISLQMKKQYLKNFYQKPMMAQQHLSRFSISPSEPKVSLSTLANQNPLSYQGAAQGGLPSVQVGQVQSSGLGSTTYIVSKEDSQRKSFFNQRSRQLDPSKSTLTENPSSWVSRTMRVSVKASSTNTRQALMQQQSTPEKKLFSATWYGEKPSRMLQSVGGPQRQGQVAQTARTTLMTPGIDMARKSIPFSSRSIVPGPLKKRLTLPLNGAKSARESAEDSMFIPVRAIVVPHERTYEVKKQEDFRNMKNLFLANCLKLKDGEQGFSEEMQKTLSSRIKANRGGLSPIIRKCN